MSTTAAASLSRETLWLRFGGMILMLAGAAACAWLGRTADLLERLRDAGRDGIMPWAPLWLAAVNAVCLGLILLLAGLGEVSLRTSARARRGTLVRIAAANLLIPCFLFAALQDAGALDELLMARWYIGVALLAAFVVMARWGVAAFRAGWKYDARSAEQALAADSRPPVLYLRSFHEDRQVLVTGGGPAAAASRWLNYAASVSPEQELAFILDRVGPVIAIGKPGERLPELGAARRYVADDQWRDVVHQWMRDAALVVIRAGETENLWWEIEQARAICAPDRVIIVALGQPGSLPAFQRRFVSAIGEPLKQAQLAPYRYEVLLRLMLPVNRSIGRIIYFDPSGSPHEQPLQFRLTWTGIALAAFRPYRDSLQAAFKVVFRSLGLRWQPRRSLTIAVLLALGGGLFGLHHFYMGHSRRGWWHVAFFWIGLPMVVGWIDAARLSLLDDAAFQRRVQWPDAAEASNRR